MFGFMSKLSLHTGVTLLVMSLVLMIPSCIGVEEYNTRLWTSSSS